MPAALLPGMAASGATLAMKRLTQAPNVALATLWADLLQQAGVDAVVQRAYTSSIAGEIPPDQALPEVWVLDDGEHARALALLDALRHLPWQRWSCRGCGEIIDGPFEQCWNCGAMRPET
jgi:anti-sigma-K factor RskA